MIAADGSVTLSGYGVTFEGVWPWTLDRCRRHANTHTPHDTLVVTRTDLFGRERLLLVMPHHEDDDLVVDQRMPRNGHLARAGGTLLLRDPGSAGFDDFGRFTPGPPQGFWTVAADGVSFALPEVCGVTVTGSTLEGVQVHPTSSARATLTFSGPFDERSAPPLMSFVSGHEEIEAVGEQDGAAGYTWIDVRDRRNHRAWRRISGVPLFRGPLVVVSVRADEFLREHLGALAAEVARSIRVDRERWQPSLSGGDRTGGRLRQPSSA